MFDTVRYSSDFYPDWLPAPLCKVFLVRGPAGGGKSTYCAEAATDFDAIIDLDECFEKVCGVFGHDAGPEFLAEALIERNLQLQALSRKSTGVAYFINSAPKKSDVYFWESILTAETVSIVPTLETILSRDISDRRKFLAQDWFREAE
ncbi:MAG: hypothetical protein AAF198_06280 [Pseudomonadota bacterium]